MKADIVRTAIKKTIFKTQPVLLFLAFAPFSKILKEVLPAIVFPFSKTYSCFAFFSENSTCSFL